MGKVTIPEKNPDQCVCANPGKSNQPHIEHGPEYNYSICQQYINSIIFIEEEWLWCHGKFQIFYRWYHGNRLVQFPFLALIQIIPFECWFQCNDVMFDPFQMPQRWRHSSRHVKMHCPLSQTHFYYKCSMIQIFNRGCQSHTVHHHVSALHVLHRESNVGAWLAWREGKMDSWRWTTPHGHQPVASVMHSLKSDVNEHGTVTFRNFTA